MSLTKLTLILVFTANLFAAAKFQTVKVFAPPIAYRGYNTYVFLRQGWYDSYDVTFNTGNSEMTGTGSGWVDTQTILFFPQSGATMPNVLNIFGIPYTPCPVGTDVYRIIAAGISSCADTQRLVEFAQAGSGDMEAGLELSAGTPAGSSVFTNWVLPSGVTVSACYTNGRSTAPDGTTTCTTVGMDYAVFGGIGSPVFALTVASNATLGATTIEFDVESNTGSFTTVHKTFDIEIMDVPRIPVAHPTTYPTLPSLATWEARMLTEATAFCNKATGAWNPATSTWTFGTETTGWYYDGSMTMRQIANYTGDADWIRCADSAADWYRDQMYSNSGTFSTTNKMFTFGQRMAGRNWVGSYKKAIQYVWENNIVASGGAQGSFGNVTQIGIRPSAYILESAINYAKSYGYSHFGKIPAGNLRNWIQRVADTAIMQAQVQTGPDYNNLQAFQMGLLLWELILWKNYSGDPRVLPTVIDTLDMIEDEMWMQPGGPTDTVAYFRGGPVPPTLPDPDDEQGPNCPYSCNPIGMEPLQPMLSMAFAWGFAMTGSTAYRDIAVAMFEEGADYNAFSQKEFNEQYRTGIYTVQFLQGKIGRAYWP